MIKIRTLDCGVRMAMEEIPYVQSVSMGIWVNAGASDESAKISGVSHFIEHMMFKGTTNRTAKQIAEETDKIAGQMNAFTGKEATCYYIKTLASNAEKAADILLDMFLNSKYDKIEMNKEKQVIIEEMKMIEDSPDENAHDIICELVFAGNALGKSIIGTPTSLKGISRNALLQYMEDEYTRNNVVVAVSGSFDEEKICSLFQEQLKVLPTSKTAKSFEETPYTPAYRVKVKDIEQSHICLGTRSINLEHPDYYAFAVLNNIIGGSMSSRLFQNIREQKGLAYAVYSMNSAFKNMGYFTIYAGVGHDKIEDAITGIKEELELLKKYGVTEEELCNAKEQIKGSYIYGQENVNGRMFSIGKSTVLLNKVHTTEEVIGGIDAVNMDDMERITAIVSDIKNYSGAAVTNRKIDLKKMITK